MTYTEHRTTGDVVVTGTSLASMSIVGATAVLLGNATVNGVAGYTFQATVTDNGDPGVNRDLLGLQVNGGPDPGVTFGATAITSGNLQLHLQDRLR